ncbi:MAG: M57 family metalloprotease [Flavobacteriaceae bacterium]
MKKLLLLVICALFFFSCSNQNEGTGTFPNPDDEISNIDPSIQNAIIPDSLQYLKDYLINDLKFKKDNIAFEDNEFILENDMTISIEGLIRIIEFNKENNIDPTAHYASSGCSTFSPSPVRDNFCPGRNCSHDDEIYYISVDINGSVPQAWRQATINAMNNWNNLQNNRMNFILEDRNCDIRAWDGIEVYLYSTSSTSTLASAALPVQVPGYRIRINTNSSSYSTNDIPYFTRIMMHEFGHTLGYKHTDQTNGCFINGSPTTDNASVMNSTTSPSSSYIGLGFSNGDITAHDLLYPSADNSARIVEFNCRI